MLNIFHKSPKSHQDQDLPKTAFEQLGLPSHASVSSTLLGSDAAPRERNHSVFSAASHQLPTTLLRPGLDARRSSTSSTYSEQAQEEAALPKEERVRLALARLRGPQYEELSGRIYGPWY